MKRIGSWTGATANWFAGWARAAAILAIGKTSLAWEAVVPRSP